ncbi:MAG: hypothetical protein ACTHL8_06355 [Burkholderiaceae bacterium]
MKSIHPLIVAAAAAAVAAFAGGASQAQTELSPKPLTNARPASAASAAGERRQLSFNTHHQVPATITLRDAIVSDGWEGQFRFAGQTDTHDCRFHTIKAGETARAGRPVTGYVVCSTPWQVYDNGLAFQVFQAGELKGSGTIRP